MCARKQAERAKEKLQGFKLRDDREGKNIDLDPHPFLYSSLAPAAQVDDEMHRIRIFFLTKYILLLSLLLLCHRYHCLIHHDDGAGGHGVQKEKNERDRSVIEEVQEAGAAVAHDVKVCNKTIDES